MSKIKLADALLRRKELNSKVVLLGKFKEADVYELKFARKKVSEDFDDITAQVPKLTASQVTSEFDFYSRQLRLCDSTIQQANWTVEVEVKDDVMLDFEDRTTKPEK